jgi:hypothetical protein
MKARLILMLLLVLLAATPAAASDINPLVAPTAPWAGHIREMDEALAQKNVDAAERAWHDAYLAALGSRFWQGMVEVGDASLRIGAVRGFRKVSEATARQAYLAALSRASQLGSLEGVLRTAQALAVLGDRAVVERCLRVAENLASQTPTAQAKNRVRALKAQLAAMKWEEQ